MNKIFRNVCVVLGLIMSIGLGIYVMLPKSRVLPKIEIQLTADAAAAMLPPSGLSVQAELIEAKEKDLLEFSQASLVRLLELANSDSDPSLVESAIVLANIEQKFELDSRMRDQVLSFYQDCAKLHDLAAPVRAVCFSKAVRLSLLLRGQVWNPKEIPQNVKELATQL